MENYLTVKPVITSKALLANVLVFAEAFGDDPKASIPKNILEERLGMLFLEKMEQFKDKAYFHNAIEYVKGNNNISEIAKKLKRTLQISQFMDNVSESISKEFITFTNIGIGSGDYVFLLKTEFSLANFIANKRVSDGQNIDLQKTVSELFSSFTNDFKILQDQINFLINSNQFDNFKKFSGELLDTTLRECLKMHKIDDVIKGLVDGGFGEFAVVGG